MKIGHNVPILSSRECCMLLQRIDQQVQRALNMDNFDLAKVLREDRQELDGELEKLLVHLISLSHLSLHSPVHARTCASGSRT